MKPMVDVAMMLTNAFTIMETAHKFASTTFKEAIPVNVREAFI
jgi:hypothetical protein